MDIIKKIVLEWRRLGVAILLLTAAVSKNFFGVELTADDQKLVFEMIDGLFDKFGLFVGSAVLLWSKLHSVLNKKEAE